MAASFYEDYNNELSSTITDLNNAPLGGMAGAITAALFLKNLLITTRCFCTLIFMVGIQNQGLQKHMGLMQGVRSLGAAIEEKISTS